METIFLIALVALLLIFRQSVIIILLAGTAAVHYYLNRGNVEYLIDDMWVLMDNAVLLAIPLRKLQADAANEFVS